VQVTLALPSCRRRRRRGSTNRDTRRPKRGKLCDDASG